MVGRQGDATTGSSSRTGKITSVDVRARKHAGPALVVVTAYDYTMARLVDEAGVDVVLVGDSLGMVVQGLPNTLGVTIEEMCYHGRCVARAQLRAHLVGDMPFMSYQVSPAQAVASAGKMVKEGLYEAVKLEGGEEVAEHVSSITRAGIPVMGHIGLQPQSVHLLGGFRVQGRDGDSAARLVTHARALESAGAYALVLEAIPPQVAETVTAAIRIPTIGIGAGAKCDGQVLVCNDLLGLSQAHLPRFAKRYVELADEVVRAVSKFGDEVRAGAFPAPEHTYEAKEPERKLPGSA